MQVSFKYLWRLNTVVSYYIINLPTRSFSSLLEKVSSILQRVSGFLSYEGKDQMLKDFSSTP